MKTRVLTSIVAPLFILTSCSWQSPREEKHKLELSLHKIRTDIDDMKHDLNTSDIELHILEGKVIDQEDTISSMKEMINTSQSGKIDELQKLLSSLNKELALLKKQQGEILGDLKSLSDHATDTNNALTQYKDKIGEMEKAIGFQNKKFEEVSKLKKNLSSLVQSIKNETFTYTIKEGDSLEKISKHFSVSVDEIKKTNNIKEDLIFKGQQLVIPKR